MFPYTEWGERVISVGLDGIVALPDMYMREQSMYEKKNETKVKKEKKIGNFQVLLHARRRFMQEIP